MSTNEFIHTCIIIVGIFYICIPFLVSGCAQFTIIPAKYCYILKTDIDSTKACLLERKLANC